MFFSNVSSKLPNTLEVFFAYDADDARWEEGGFDLLIGLRNVVFYIGHLWGVDMGGFILNSGDFMFMVVLHMHI